MPVEDNLYEDKAKEIAKKNESIHKKAQQQEIRAKSSKNNSKHNKVYIFLILPVVFLSNFSLCLQFVPKNKPKNYEKLPIINTKREENLKKNAESAKKLDPITKKFSSPEIARHPKSMTNSVAKINNNNNNMPKNDNGNQIKPLSKQDLNKWFEKCINRMEKDPDVAASQKEKLDKTKENLAKIGNSTGA